MPTRYLTELRPLVLTTGMNMTSASDKQVLITWANGATSTVGDASITVVDAPTGKISFTLNVLSTLPEGQALLEASWDMADGRKVAPIQDLTITDAPINTYRGPITAVVHV